MQCSSNPQELFSNKENFSNNCLIICRCNKNIKLINTNKNKLIINMNQIQKLNKKIEK